MFKSMLHSLISFALNVVRGDRWDLKWFFRAEDSGGGSRVWHGRSVLVHRHLHRAAQRRFCTTGSTCRHSFSLTIDSASLIVTILPPCFSSLWPRASSPLKSLPHSGFPLSSHLSLLSCGWIIHGELKCQMTSSVLIQEASLHRDSLCTGVLGG